MKPLEYCHTMARYNRWMNERTYALCETIPDEIRKQDRGAFFKSMHGTLNHLLLADRLWLGRFLDRPFAFESLDQELYSDFVILRQERAATDAEIEAWADSLTEEQLDGTLTFFSVVKQAQHTFALWHAVLHFFNHQTHHRGQLTTLLTQAGYDIGVTDLLWLPGAQLPA